MKKIIVGIIVLAVIVLVIGAISNSGKSDPVPEPVGSTTTAPVISLSSRSFKMGFVPVPAQPLSTANWLGSFELFGNNAEVIMHHLHFESNNLDGAAFVDGMNKKFGLETFFTIDPLSNDRLSLDPDLKKAGKNFGDDKVRQSYKDLAVKTAETYQPAYLSLGSEVNTYLQKNPSDLQDFVSLVNETIPLVKQASPDSIVTLSLQFEELNGQTGKDEWFMVPLLAEKLDALAFTTYPSLFFKTPADIPLDYYSQFKKYTDKPLLLVESGWPAGGSSSYHGSLANQAAFVARLPELTKDLNLGLWIWWFPHDQAGDGYPDFFRTMGLRQSDGTPKLSWKTWTEIQQLPIK
jgi:hypothetical protein